MKKNHVIVISIIAISVVALAYYLLGPSAGVTSATSEPERIVLKAPYMDRDIDLSGGISPDIWDSIPPEEVKLLYQVMVLPWEKSLSPPVTVEAFHNGKDIYFYMSWKDETENRDTGISRFPDASAIMFPMEDNAQNNTIMMGFNGKSNIWQWKASLDKEYWLMQPQESGAYSDFYYPFEENETLVVSKAHPMTAVHDLIAIRVGTVTEKPYHNVEGRGIYDNGAWHVVFKRSLKQADPELDAAFTPGEKKTIAFAVWNGENGDRGGRKSISDWVTLDVAPEGAK